MILAYNSESAFDTVIRESQHAGLDPEHLEDPANWRSIALERNRFRGHRLGGEFVNVSKS
jgi:hypothetical protein